MITEESISAAHILPLHIYPDPILSHPCEPLVEDTKTLHEIAHAMIATMRHHNGVGLAGPQVGILNRIFVTETTPGFPLVFVNPSIVLDDEKMFEWEEGCLSIPGVFHKTKRPHSCEITYQHIDGEFNQVYKSEGFEAFAIQHEMDHLMGRLFIDDWSKLKLDRVQKKIAKTKRKK